MRKGKKVHLRKTTLASFITPEKTKFTRSPKTTCSASATCDFEDHRSFKTKGQLKVQGLHYRLQTASNAQKTKRMVSSLPPLSHRLSSEEHLSRRAFAKGLYLDEKGHSPRPRVFYTKSGVKSTNFSIAIPSKAIANNTDSSMLQPLSYTQLVSLAMEEHLDSCSPTAKHLSPSQREDDILDLQQGYISSRFQKDYLCSPFHERRVSKSDEFPRRCSDYSSPANARNSDFEQRPLKMRSTDSLRSPIQSSSRVILGLRPTAESPVVDKANAAEYSLQTRKRALRKRLLARRGGEQMFCELPPIIEGRGEMPFVKARLQSRPCPKAV